MHMRAIRLSDAATYGRVLRLIASAYSLVLVACVPCGTMFDGVTLRGRVADADTSLPIDDAVLGGRSFTGGEETDFVPPFTRFGTQNGPSATEDGSFQLGFVVIGGTCQGFLGNATPPEFPRPDRVEIIVARDGCEQSFLIDVNEDTVVDLSFPDDVIELKDPILVPPCEE
ncbi:MAG: hypothetical protein IIC01_03995 [Planctomycetes bacterium]|nr:hypothetical protein [Planctomycetota bacterium]